jgi:hypothetical protein
VTEEETETGISDICGKDHWLVQYADADRMGACLTGGITWTYDGETGNYMSTMTFEKSALPATL